MFWPDSHPWFRRADQPQPSRIRDNEESATNRHSVAGDQMEGLVTCRANHPARHRWAYEAEQTLGQPAQRADPVIAGAAPDAAHQIMARG